MRLVEIEGTKPPVTPIYNLAQQHPARAAVVDGKGAHTYAEVLTKCLRLSAKIREALANSPEPQKRIGILCPNDVT